MGTVNFVFILPVPSSATATLQVGGIVGISSVFVSPQRVQVNVFTPTTEVVGATVTVPASQLCSSVCLSPHSQLRLCVASPSDIQSPYLWLWSRG